MTIVDTIEERRVITLKDLEQDPAKLRELFDTTDSNKDGGISFEEFRKLLE